MLYGQVIEIFNEANLSPEDLAGWIGVSNSTYRRWQKEPVKGEFPKEYTQNVSTGVFRLLTSGKLSYDSERVSNFVEKNIPEYFASAIGQLSDTQELFVEGSTHQDNITAVLSQLGSSSGSRKRVDDAKKEIAKFTGWGSEWKRRIRLLSRVIVDKRLTLVDRLVAYGALFYLILPFDLIPDTIPVFGYVDDFGMLGFAAAFYAKRFPSLIKESGIENGITDAILN